MKGKSVLLLVGLCIFLGVCGGCGVQRASGPESHAQDLVKESGDLQMMREFCATKDAQSILHEWRQGVFAYEVVLVRGEWCPGHMNMDGIMFFLKSRINDRENVDNAKQRMIDEVERVFGKKFDGEIKPMWWVDHSKSEISIIVIYSN